MSDKPLVSVIIPTFNRAAVLPRTVECVLAQTYRPLQLIIVNDGGRDDTPQVLAGLEAKVRAAGVEPTFVNKANGGCATARNEAFRQVRGEYFAFLDDDDQWLPEKIAKQVAELQSSGANACCTQARKLITRGEIIQPEPERLVRGTEPGSYVDGRTDAHLITLVVATRLLPTVGDFDTDLRTGSDTEWIGRLCHFANFCAVPEILAVYTYSDDALSRVGDMQAELRRDTNRMLAVERLREKCHTLPNWDEAAWRRRAAQVYDQCVKHQLYAGDLVAARELFDKGMRLTQGTAPLPRVRRKIRKAWWLSLVGRRLKHPKLAQTS
jgi:glycosyltransferase involved in cell wall biosynthesis